MQITITTNIDDDKLPMLAEFLKSITAPAPQFVEPGVKPTKKAKPAAKAEPVTEELPFATKFPAEPAEITLKNDVTLTDGKFMKRLEAGKDTVNEMQELVNAGWTVQEDAPKNDLVALAEANPVEAPKKSAITKTDLRAVALKLSKAGKSEELAKIFGDFGASNLSSIKEADYEAVMERLVSANA